METIKVELPKKQKAYDKMLGGITNTILGFKQ
jgi:hypothetical protein